ncbi:DNA polymerase III subunit delta' [Uliginosibacterium sp. 31-16]|uniref:DNA polymerase III subunit delta' n=1 Tax=Uliginosibacterium sp. 31-16 TaxID=3068315 RepID=UPI0027401B68|nr:DNA polymerase III subunit delta' [Uliginosibacterium sp. 31-16]MDP5239447.1 DNA polymerase III subunit delta' [Uliginosibacterium sp. 31-16]
MRLETLPDWLLPLWQDLHKRGTRLPHALLLSGPEGSGKRLFAEHLARALLCQSPDDRGFSCGTCADCKWIESGNHPDMFTLIPAADEAAAEEEGDGGAESGKKEKAKSTQIVIDQVRSLQASLEVGAGGHAGGRRLVIVDPAEAMNMAAANALLKALEEPNGSTVYLMLSNAPRRLLPTIRSRCQVLDFPRPDTGQAVAWMRGEGIENEALLGFVSGLPLAARNYAKGVLFEARRKVASDLATLGVRDPLKLSADWESSLKAKGAQEGGFTMPILINWLQRWLSDGVRVAGGHPARFFADYTTDLTRQAKGRSEAWLNAYREIETHRRMASHPLNQRLFLEEMLLSVYRRIAIR